MKMNARIPLMTLCFSAGLLFFSSCEKDQMIEPGTTENLSMSSSSNGKKILFYGLSTTNEIVKFSTGNSAADQGAVDITGLQSNEQIVAIDYRPSTGQLYGVSNQSRMYAINPMTGRASAISAEPFTPAIDGELVGFDFNPTVDRIRLITENEQNLRLHPETGKVALIDGTINPGDRHLVAAAYTNSFAGATTTTLYTIDFKAGKLFKQIPPNDGTQVEVGSLSIQNTGNGGFDISPDNSVALAVVNQEDEDGFSLQGQGKKTVFYDINLLTGKATVAGVSRRNIIGVAIPTQPIAYAVDPDNQLMIFNPERVNDMIIKPITGLVSGEKIVGLDMRPATGQLYALGNSSRLYVINMASGAAMAVGTAPFSQRLNGSWFGFDFNPTVDRIRIVSNEGQNLRVHPVTGDIAFVDGALNPGSPRVDAAAYSQNFAGTTTTSLYVMDYESDMLFLQSPPNAGVLSGAMSLSMDIMSANGFDIGGTSGRAMGIFTIEDNTHLCSVNLGTGEIEIRSYFPDNVRGFTLGLGF